MYYNIRKYHRELRSPSVFPKGGVGAPVIFLYILLGLAALILLLLILPIQIFLRYNREEGFRFRVKYAWIPLLDSTKEKEEPQEEKPKEKKPKGKKKKKKKSGGAASSLLKFLGLEDIASIADAKKALDEKGLVQMLADVSAAVGAILARTGKLIGRGVFKRFTLRVVVGDEDAADAAMTYGRICGIIYPTITILDSLMTFRRRTVDLRCDFSQEHTIVTFDGQLNYRPWNFIQFLGGLILNYFKRSVK